jgi:hypothetical protein
LRRFERCLAIERELGRVETEIAGRPWVQESFFYP